METSRIVALRFIRRLIFPKLFPIRASQRSLETSAESFESKTKHFWFIMLGVSAAIFLDKRNQPLESSPFLGLSALRNTKKFFMGNIMHRDLKFFSSLSIIYLLQNLMGNAPENEESHIGYEPKKPDLRLSDFLGQEKAKQEMTDIVEFVKNSENYRIMGAKIPKGILLTGPPGTGKTLLAEALAGETGMNFFSVSASELMNKYIGESAANVKKLFNLARVHSPSIVFIDELDSIGSKRSGENSCERESALNQLLVELDGANNNDLFNVIVVAATNLSDKIDQALMRPGRFDRIIKLSLPDSEGRASILAGYLSKLRLSKEKVKKFSQHIALSTSGLTGAELANLCNEAAIRAVRLNKQSVEISDLEFAAERISSTKSSDGVSYNNIKEAKGEEKILLKDVAGQDEAKMEVQEIIDFLKKPEKYIKIGAKMPRGLLLVGPPGTGKTLFAKALSGEAGVPFFFKSGSEFIEKFAGVGASRIRELFAEARKLSPCIIFIDEIDSVGGKRSGNENSGETEATLNQILVEMDGFKKFTGILIGATNRKDMMDPALLRPGRFDRIIELKLPDYEGRREILSLHLKNYLLDKTYSIPHYANFVANFTDGYSGAELANLCNEAAILAIRSGNERVHLEDLKKAVEKSNNRRKSNST